MNQLADIVAEIERLNRARAQLDLELATAMERFRAIANVATATSGLRPDLGLKDLISSAEAADLVRRAKSTLNTWCRENAINGNEGFAIQIGPRWFVSKSRLLRHLASGSRD